MSISNVPITNGYWHSMLVEVGMNNHKGLVRIMLDRKDLKNGRDFVVKREK